MTIVVKTDGGGEFTWVLSAEMEEAIEGVISDAEKSPNWSPADSNRAMGEITHYLQDTIRGLLTLLYANVVYPPALYLQMSTVSRGMSRIASECDLNLETLGPPQG